MGIHQGELNIGSIGSSGSSGSIIGLFATHSWLGII